VRIVRRLLHRSDDGAAAVEFALLFPIFAMLVFGTISAGFAFSRQINITQSAREASRYGSTLSVLASHNTGGVNDGTADTWLSNVDAATTAAAGTGTFAGYTSRCVALVLNGSGSYSLDGGTKVTGTHCPGASDPSGLTNYVQVVISRSTDFNFLVADPTITLWSVSTTPYEAASA
jgi:Flp pilus assembly protein TadG